MKCYASLHIVREAHSACSYYIGGHVVCLLGNFQIPYSAKFWQEKTLAKRSFQIFGEENFGEFTIA